MLTEYMRKAIELKRTDIRDNAANATSLSIVSRTESGTLGDYYNRGKKYYETITTVTATGGFNSGYSYDETSGGMVEKSGLQFELSADYLATLRSEHAYIRFSGKDYYIDSVLSIPDTAEIVLTASRLK
jgi:hypothetical protein